MRPTPSRELIDAAKKWHRLCDEIHWAWDALYRMTQGVEHPTLLRDAAMDIARAELAAESASPPTSGSSTTPATEAPR